MKSESVQLSINSHPKNLKHIRNKIADLISKSSVSKQDLAGIVLAVDEACSNIIRHSYKNDHTRKINLEILLEANRLIITITDNGIGFDINSIESRDTSSLAPGGRGIHIIKQVMDLVEYSRTGQESNQIKRVNSVKMVKNLLS